MPTYQYQCRDCGLGFEQYQKFSDDSLSECPTCEGTVRRVIQNVGIVFKGSGWYINDSRKSSRAANGASDGTASDAPKTEGAESVAKPATPSSENKGSDTKESKTSKNTSPAAATS